MEIGWLLNFSTSCYAGIGKRCSWSVKQIIVLFLRQLKPPLENFKLHQGYSASVDVLPERFPLMRCLPVNYNTESRFIFSFRPLSRQWSLIIKSTTVLLILRADR